MQRSLLAAALLSALFAATTAAAQTMDAAKKRGALRLGYSETSAPFAFKSKDDGKPVGYSVELCKRIASAVASAGGPSKVEWVPTTPATRLEAVAKGDVDIECGTTSITMARREKVDFSLPIFVDAATILARKASATTIAELQGKKIAVAEQTTTLDAVEKGLAKRFVKAEVVKTKTVLEAFEMLKDGKVDAMASDRTKLVGTFLVGGGAEGLIVFAEDLSYEPYGLAVRRNDGEFRLIVDRTLASLYRSGQIEEVYGQWLAPLGKPGIPLMSMYLLNSYPE
ncbi:MAG TPA: amino acid ABC transporter substrate-binding protein [Usitatibacter sp.]|nr:amino acid ABC transporter substrate-binding protein [Usitatibacter sp.]